MLVKEIVREKEGRKWRIVKHGENNYYVDYYEFYKACGWLRLFTEGNWSKDAVEFTFGVVVA